MSAPVRRMAVIGSGVAAAMAALAVARAFGRLGTEVTWIEFGEPPPRHAALIAPPDFATFHHLLGIDEASLIAGTSATLNLGQQFAGWSGGEGAFLHAYGDAGSAFASLPFIQHWIRARHAGLNVALEDFCLAAAAAKEGRIGTPRNPDMRQAVKQGYHLDSTAYARLLREHGKRAGVRIVRSESIEPVCDGARLARAVLADGSAIEADLFIDADGALIEAVDPGGAKSVAPWCDRMIRASAPRFDPLPLFSRVTAHRAGWTTLIPLGDRTAIEFVYASGAMQDDEAGATLARILGRSIETGNAEAVGSMARVRPWVGNCVAVGAAAGDAPPLDGAELLLLQLAVAQLVLLWPVDRNEMVEAAIYNEEAAGSRARIGDFCAQHFRLNGRRGEPYWDTARGRPISPELAAKIDLFSARGMFAHFNHEAHVEDGWALAMTGHGILPRSSDPQTASTDDPTLMVEFRRQLQAIAREVRAMETHAQALRRIGATRG